MLLAAVRHDLAISPLVVILALDPRGMFSLDRAITEQEKLFSLFVPLEGEKAAWDTFVRQYSGLVFHTIKRTLVLYTAIFPIT